MSWNYRVFKRTHPSPEGPIEEFFIGEAYYDKDGDYDGGYSDNYAGMVSGLGLDELKESVKLIARALEKPVIDLGEKTDARPTE